MTKKKTEEDEVVETPVVEEESEVVANDTAEEISGAELDAPDDAPAEDEVEEEVEATATPTVEATTSKITPQNFYVEGYGNIKGVSYADAKKNADAVKQKIREP